MRTSRRYRAQFWPTISRRPSPKADGCVLFWLRRRTARQSNGALCHLGDRSPGAHAIADRCRWACVGASRALFRASGGSSRNERAGVGAEPGSRVLSERAAELIALGGGAQIQDPEVGRRVAIERERLSFFFDPRVPAGPVTGWVAGSEGVVHERLRAAFGGTQVSRSPPPRSSGRRLPLCGVCDARAWRFHDGHRRGGARAMAKGLAHSPCAASSVRSGSAALGRGGPCRDRSLRRGGRPKGGIAREELPSFSRRSGAGSSRCQRGGGVVAR